MDAKTAFVLAQGTSVLAGEELRRAARATLGETLAGVASSYYGPGSSRPVIRGLGGDRIRALNNGIGSLDASNVSPDHNAASDPLSASRIEVLRGPSTLLYGSSAIGGAVNVIDNRIPDAAPEKKLGGTLEARAGGADRQRAGVLSLTAGEESVAFHVNALRQETRDLKIPGVARIDAGAPASQPEGFLPNSATDTTSGSFGVSRLWKQGYVGAALSRYETVYGVPTGGEPGITLDMKQTRLDLAGELRRVTGIFRGVKARLGFGDYTHSELSGGTITNTTFKNRAWEGRVELPHATLGGLSGTIGVQAARSDFSARGEEVVTPASVTQSGALFLVEEKPLADHTSLQFGARYETQAIKLGEVDPTLPVVPGYAAVSGQKTRSNGASVSLGVVHRPAKDWSIAASLVYSERLPATAELFSNGPHGGTAAYEVGTTGLGNERSLGVDIMLRRRAGSVTGTIGGFVNRFADYIFEQPLPPGAIPEENNEEDLTPYQFVATDALFYGGEAELTFHLVDRSNGPHLHLDFTADYVLAEERPRGAALPRITPLRIGGRLGFEAGRWTAGVEVRRTTRQHRYTPAEGPTSGYTFVHADVSYQISRERTSHHVFLRGYNLGNEEGREHTSFLKNLAPLGGRSFSAGVRVMF